LMHNEEYLKPLIDLRTGGLKDKKIFFSFIF